MPSSDFLRSFLLDLAYGAGLLAASPWLAFKLRNSERYRAGLKERLGDIPVRESDRPCLWIHAASVGEGQAARPLVAECRRRFPDLDIAVSTQTKTGQEMVRSALPDCICFYYPLDLSCCVRRALDRIRPSCIALVEREIWPNFTAAAKSRGIPVVQVNSRLSASSLKSYRWLYPVIGETLQSMDRFIVQSEEYAERLRQLAIPDERIQVAGNLKYDGIPTTIDSSDVERLRRETGIHAVTPPTPVWVCGSIHPEEVSVAVRAWLRCLREVPEVRLLFAPRHLERIPEIEKDLQALGVAHIRKTEMAEGGLPEKTVLIADTMGELRGLYALATVVFVGGTFNQVGGHNLIEPAALGKPVLFGPHIHAQGADAGALVAAGGAEQCQTEEALAKQVCRLFNDRARAESMGLRAQEVILGNTGAAEKTVDIISPYLTGETIDEQP
ncbi:MAG: 3-deoxy-D-manno-octulosonic acid transferase [Planctomycetota bacterium]|nr:3-deoxy-D-manno-octulosonic acid transferase [Planctomycetota bacterium]